MRYIADLHPHSYYARACSPELTIPNLAKWAKNKGLHIVGTGDFTHPVWLQDLKMDLIEIGSGIYKYREMMAENDPYFILTVETSHVFTQDGRGRRIHIMIWAPNFSVVDKINAELSRRGANLMSDGRPMTGLTLLELAEAIFGVDETCLIVPAHAWTPWYGIFGDKGGFDSLSEAFGDYASQIHAVETGLSSDPAMNWQIPELENRQIVSFSDAHSPWKLGREATVFEFENFTKEGYQALYEAITQLPLRGPQISQSSQNKIAATIEFYPEEGKYHYTGHRKCGIRQSPQETKEKGERCPVCGQQLTIGVMHRVEELASVSSVSIPSLPSSPSISNQNGVNLYQDPQNLRPPYYMLVPLTEIIAEAKNSGVNTKTVLDPYHQLVNHFGSEFAILLKTPVTQIATVAGERIAEGVDKVRRGNLVIEPGFDGVFGTVKIWGEKEEISPSGPVQESLF